MLNANIDSTSFISLNCYGYKGNCIYIDNLAKSYDCLSLSELWLTQSEFHLLHHFKKDFTIIFHPATQQEHGRPFGGTALLLRKSKFKNTTTILKEDYVSAVQTSLSNRKFVVMSLYLQCISAKADYLQIYRSQLASLTGIINQFTDTADPILLGDFQCCPVTPISSRSGEPNVLSKYLSDFINENELLPIDITHGEGPNYTYQHFTLANSSYIDHILVPVSSIETIIKVSVLDPDPDNTSDHLPVSAIFHTPSTPTINEDAVNNTLESDFVPNHLWKNDKFVDLYRSYVATAINKLDFSSEDALDEFHSTLRSCASEACKSFKETAYVFQSKPWWNDDIRKAHKILRSMFNIWKHNGFPKSPTDTSYCRYRFARKSFRYHIKRAKSNATARHYINIDKLKDVKPASYWKRLRSLRNDDQKLYTINGKSNKSDITDEFHSHFNNLLNTPRVPNTNNAESNLKLNELLQQINQDPSDDFYVTESDVADALSRLKFGKSRDPFQIKAEHFLCAESPTFKSYLTDLLNKLFSSSHLPSQLGTSILIPLVKTFKKSLNDPNNYRGISLIPIMTKVIELVILIKCPDISNHTDSQFGFVAGSSTLHAELLISDTLKYYNNRGSSVYVCSLDAEKAFDSCNWHTLFCKLQNRDIPNQVLAMLIKLYLNGSAIVHYAAHYSKELLLTQGVRQGSILSPFMYSIYIEDLLLRVKSLQIGTFLPNNLHTGIIAYADDIILMSPTLSHLQMMIDHCIDHGVSNCLKYNQIKTQFTISGKPPIRNPVIRINNTVIQKQETLKHLGFQWEIDKNILTLKRHMLDRIACMWSVATSLISAGIRKCHPNQIVTLFRSIVIPKLLYGLELVELNKSDAVLLNTQARICLKALFGISKKSRNLLNTIYNLPDVTTHINKRKLSLLHLATKNPSIAAYMYHMLSSGDNISHSFTYTANSTVNCLNLDIVHVLLDKNYVKRNVKSLVPDQSDEVDFVVDLIDNWHMMENRILFRAKLEENVLRL